MSFAQGAASTIVARILWANATDRRRTHREDGEIARFSSCGLPFTGRETSRALSAGCARRAPAKFGKSRCFAETGNSGGLEPATRRLWAPASKFRRKHGIEDGRRASPRCVLIPRRGRVGFMRSSSTATGPRRTSRTASRTLSIGRSAGFRGAPSVLSLKGVYSVDTGR